MGRDEIFSQVRAYLVSLFDVAPDAITLESNLQTDLDLDSIDAVDLIVKVQEFIGQKIKPDDFKTVRTVGDVVDRIYDLTNAKAT
ncbi:MAG TPA: acyl carrier protein [Rhizomicrobium sp.]|nr:acyl carrier protein [Rhizomicrobium sp.]